MQYAVAPITYKENIMKARLVPVYFPSGKDDEFSRQLSRLKRLLDGEAENTNPCGAGFHPPRG